ncbi:hypothetical protein [uncultured Shimia sp.]|uniref:hypothetical protein n=1 Tax=uncultured Shimia sp. TaxID=573152 RepID=UPI00262D0994|nr:hypothetical protein [uncultured Shimia sp.]
MPSIKTAPTASRKLIKSLAFRRRELFLTAKQARDGVAGADRETDTQIARIRKHVHRATEATEAAQAAADDFNTASLILKSGTDCGPLSSPVSRLAALSVRLGGSSALTDLVESAAHQARDAATLSQDRLDNFSDDIAASLAACDLVEAQRDGDDARVRRTRRKYQFHKDAHSERTAR